MAGKRVSGLKLHVLVKFSSCVYLKLLFSVKFDETRRDETRRDETRRDETVVRSNKGNRIASGGGKKKKKL